MMGETTSNSPDICKPQADFKIHGAVDDYLRSLLWRFGLCRTLKSFEAEWYDSAQKQMVQDLQTGDLPSAFKHHQLLQLELQRACTETEGLSEEVLDVAERFMMVQREKDFHQLQYRHNFIHKTMLVKDIDWFKKHIAPSELALQQIRNQYQAALKQKMLISIDKDRIQTSNEVIMNLKKPQVKEVRCNTTTTTNNN